MEDEARILEKLKILASARCLWSTIKNDEFRESLSLSLESQELTPIVLNEDGDQEKISFQQFMNICPYQESENISFHDISLSHIKPHEFLPLFQKITQTNHLHLLNSIQNILKYLKVHGKSLSYPSKALQRPLPALYLHKSLSTQFRLLKTVWMHRHPQVPGYALPSYNLSPLPYYPHLIVSTSDDGQVKMLDIRSGAVVSSLRGHNAEVHDLSVSSHGGLIATSDMEGDVRIWGPLLHPVPTFSEGVLSFFKGEEEEVMRSFSSPSPISSTSPVSPLSPHDLDCPLYDPNVTEGRTTTNSNEFSCLASISHDSPVLFVKFSPFDRELYSQRVREWLQSSSHDEKRKSHTDEGKKKALRGCFACYLKSVDLEASLHSTLITATQNAVVRIWRVYHFYSCHGNRFTAQPIAFFDAGNCRLTSLSVSEHFFDHRDFYIAMGCTDRSIRLFRRRPKGSVQDIETREKLFNDIYEKRWREERRRVRRERRAREEKPREEMEDERRRASSSIDSLFNHDSLSDSDGDVPMTRTRRGVTSRHFLSFLDDEEEESDYEYRSYLSPHIPSSSLSPPRRRSHPLRSFTPETQHYLLSDNELDQQSDGEERFDSKRIAVEYHKRHLVKLIPNVHKAAIGEVSLSPDSKYLISCAANDAICVMHVAEENVMFRQPLDNAVRVYTEMCTLKTAVNSKYSVDSLMWLQKGEAFVISESRMAVGGEEGAIGEMGEIREERRGTNSLPLCQGFSVCNVTGVVLYKIQGVCAGKCYSMCENPILKDFWFACCFGGVASLNHNRRKLKSGSTGTEIQGEGAEGTLRERKEEQWRGRVGEGEIVNVFRDELQTKFFPRECLSSCWSVCGNYAFLSDNSGCINIYGTYSPDDYRISTPSQFLFNEYVIYTTEHPSASGPLRARTTTGATTLAASSLPTSPDPAMSREDISGNNMYHPMLFNRPLINVSSNENNQLLTPLKNLYIHVNNLQYILKNISKPKGTTAFSTAPLFSSPLARYLLEKILPLLCEIAVTIHANQYVFESAYKRYLRSRGRYYRHMHWNECVSLLQKGEVFSPILSYISYLSSPSYQSVRGLRAITQGEYFLQDVKLLSFFQQHLMSFPQNHLLSDEWIRLFNGLPCERLATDGLNNAYQYQNFLFRPLLNRHQSLLHRSLILCISRSTPWTDSLRQLTIVVFPLYKFQDKSVEDRDMEKRKELPKEQGEEGAEVDKIEGTSLNRLMDYAKSKLPGQARVTREVWKKMDIALSKSGKKGHELRNPIESYLEQEESNLSLLSIPDITLEEVLSNPSWFSLFCSKNTCDSHLSYLSYVPPSSTLASLSLLDSLSPMSPRNGKKPPSFPDSFWERQNELRERMERQARNEFMCLSTRNTFDPVVGLSNVAYDEVRTEAEEETERRRGRGRRNSQDEENFNTAMRWLGIRTIGQSGVRASARGRRGTALTERQRSLQNRAVGNVVTLGTIGAGEQRGERDRGGRRRLPGTAEERDETSGNNRRRVRRLRVDTSESSVAPIESSSSSSVVESEHEGTPGRRTRERDTRGRNNRSALLANLAEWGSMGEETDDSACSLDRREETRRRRLERQMQPRPRRRQTSPDALLLSDSDSDANVLRQAVHRKRDRDRINTYQSHNQEVHRQSRDRRAEHRRGEEARGEERGRNRGRETASSRRSSETLNLATLVEKESFTYVEDGSCILQSISKEDFLLVATQFPLREVPNGRILIDGNYYIDEKLVRKMLRQCHLQDQIQIPASPFYPLDLSHLEQFIHGFLPQEHDQLKCLICKKTLTSSIQLLAPLADCLLAFQNNTSTTNDPLLLRSHLCGPFHISFNGKYQDNIWWHSECLQSLGSIVELTDDGHGIASSRHSLTQGYKKCSICNISGVCIDCDNHHVCRFTAHPSCLTLSLEKRYGANEMFKRCLKGQHILRHSVVHNQRYTCDYCCSLIEAEERRIEDKEEDEERDAEEDAFIEEKKYWKNDIGREVASREWLLGMKGGCDTTSEFQMAFPQNKAPQLGDICFFFPEVYKKQMKEKCYFHSLYIPELLEEPSLVRVVGYKPRFQSLKEYRKVTEEKEQEIAVQNGINPKSDLYMENVVSVDLWLSIIPLSVCEKVINRLLPSLQSLVSSPLLASSSLPYNFSSTLEGVSDFLVNKKHEGRVFSLSIQAREKSPLLEISEFHRLSNMLKGVSSNETFLVKDERNRIGFATLTSLTTTMEEATQQLEEAPEKRGKERGALLGYERFHYQISPTTESLVESIPDFQDLKNYILQVRPPVFASEPCALSLWDVCPLSQIPSLAALQDESRKFLSSLESILSPLEEHPSSFPHNQVIQYLIFHVLSQGYHELEPLLLLSYDFHHNKELKETYLRSIPFPIDLFTILMKAELGEYRSLSPFLAEIRLLHQNLKCLYGTKNKLVLLSGVIHTRALSALEGITKSPRRFEEDLNRLKKSLYEKLNASRGRDGVFNALIGRYVDRGLYEKSIFVHPLLEEVEGEGEVIGGGERSEESESEKIEREKREEVERMQKEKQAREEEEMTRRRRGRVVVAEIESSSSEEEERRVSAKRKAKAKPKSRTRRRSSDDWGQSIVSDSDYEAAPRSGRTKTIRKEEEPEEDYIEDWQEAEVVMDDMENLIGEYYSSSSVYSVSLPSEMQFPTVKATPLAPIETIVSSEDEDEAMDKRVSRPQKKSRARTKIRVDSPISPASPPVSPPFSPSVASPSVHRMQTRRGNRGSTIVQPQPKQNLTRRQAAMLSRSLQ